MTTCEKAVVHGGHGPFGPGSRPAVDRPADMAGSPARAGLEALPAGPGVAGT